jgi:hypothetical protein
MFWKPALSIISTDIDADFDPNDADIGGLQNIGFQFNFDVSQHLKELWCICKCTVFCVTFSDNCIKV